MSITVCPGVNPVKVPVLKAAAGKMRAGPGKWQIPFSAGLEIGLHGKAGAERIVCSGGVATGTELQLYVDAGFVHGKRMASYIIED